jgi:hypothetical protein
LNTDADMLSVLLLTFCMTPDASSLALMTTSSSLVADAIVVFLFLFALYRPLHEERLYEPVWLFLVFGVSPAHPRAHDHGDQLVGKLIGGSVEESPIVVV